MNTAAMRTLAAAAVFTLFSSTAGAQNQSPASQLEGLMQQWLAIEQQRETMRIDWQEEKLVLEQRLDLLIAESTGLQKHLKKHSGLKTKAQQKREELAAEQNTLESRQRKLSQALVQADRHVNALLPRLPEPLKNHWQENIQKLALLKEHPSKRLDLYLDMYKSFDRFREKVTVHQALMPVATQENNTEQQEILVDQIYLGVAKGWYLSRDGQYAGFGEAGSDQWLWHSDNALSEQLADILKAAKNPETARILPLNIKLSGEQL